MRCLNITGEAGRRRTAFAHALAQTLDARHVLYFEFGAELRAPQVVRIHEGEELPPESPVSAFDRIMTEACALSEAEKTVLILDQMHRSPFREHIRLFEFIKSNVWAYSDVRFFANVNNLQLYLISAEPIYHSLQQYSFNIRISAQAQSGSVPALSDLGLDEGSASWVASLHALFEQLGVAPSLQQYRRLVFDVMHCVRNRDQLRISLFGWIENIDIQRLSSLALEPYLDAVLRDLLASMGIAEEIELQNGFE
jgi:hypothetical protein